MTEILFGVLLQGLKIWQDKSANKYLNRVIELRKSWLKEYSKPRHQRNNSDLDEIEAELYIISRTFMDMGGKK